MSGGIERTGTRSWTQKLAKVFAKDRSPSIAPTVLPITVAVTANLPAPGSLHFRCNICGDQSLALISELGRETASCGSCLSTVRMRSMVHVLSQELFGECLALPDFTVRPDLIGIGMSDWDTYAIPLAHKLAYTNTFLDKEPGLDISNVPEEMVGTLDFILSSDVFEHVQPPIAKAFENVSRLLKPDGVFVFCVPYCKAPETVEHYPELHDWHIEQRDGRYVLNNRTADGRTQLFEDPELHGGEGQTLEMRRFSEIGIRRECAAAGLSVRIHDDVCFEHGIYWDKDWGITMALRHLR